jgi:hypothetical protein
MPPVCVMAPELRRVRAAPLPAVKSPKVEVPVIRSVPGPSMVLKLVVKSETPESVRVRLPSSSAAKLASVNWPP